jgi:formiminotetrahydrofolate cyclodeaminase
MTDLAESPVGDLLAGLAATDDGRAAGVACALTCAVGASLVELTAALAAARIGREGGGDERRMQEIAERAGQLRRRLPQVADQDVAVYSEVAAATGPERDAALERASGPPREVEESAAELSRLAGEVAAAGEWPFTPDAVVAGRLADAAAAGAAALIAANRAGG